MAVQPVAKSNERLISWQAAPDFAKPWTIELSNISVRQALNRIAQEIGIGYGWLASGNSEVRIFSFHERLEPIQKPE